MLDAPTSLSEGGREPQTKELAGIAYASIFLVGFGVVRQNESERPDMSRMSILFAAGALTLAVAGCNKSDTSTAIMTDAKHTHYHVHAVDASHEHTHTGKDAFGGHVHAHRHTESE